MLIGCRLLEPKNVLAAEVSTRGGIERPGFKKLEPYLFCFGGDEAPKFPYESGGGVAKPASLARCCHEIEAYLRSVLVLHTCSPIMAISISLWHMEHFIVGRNVDTRLRSAILLLPRSARQPLVQRSVMDMKTCAVGRLAVRSEGALLSPPQCTGGCPDTAVVVPPRAVDVERCWLEIRCE